MIKTGFQNILILSILTIFQFRESTAQRWQFIEDGIEFIEIDSAIWVFKIDPDKFRFKIVTSKEVLEFGKKIFSDYKPLPAFGRGINLNMFTYESLPIGYTKVEERVIQPRFNKDNLFLVWNDKEFKILDRREDDISDLDIYPNVSQNIRMIKAVPGKRNRWQVDEKKWSVSTIGTSTDGKVLFFHARKPYTMHDYISILLAQDDLLHIHRMGYAEGGPESSIYINERYNRMGSYETGFNENDDNDYFWRLPFALTFERKED